MKQKLNSILLFLILFIGQVNYVKADTTIASGTIDGTSIQWAVTSADGTEENLKLSITGSGAIPNYNSWSDEPWAGKRRKITSISLSSGITRIGNWAFGDTGISSIDLPTSCTSIGTYAFRACKNLTEMYIPSSVTSIGTGAFMACSNLSLIHFDGLCPASTGKIASEVAATGKFIEKEGRGSTCTQVPSAWDYYTHGEKCYGGAWVAESGTKLFFYAQKSGATVNYASNVAVSEPARYEPEYHPWRVNCYKYTSLEINRNIKTINFSNSSELQGYENSDVSKMGFTSLQTITVEEGNTYFVVGEDGALYGNNKAILYLYPAKNPATHIDVPSTVSWIAPAAFYGAKNLQSVTFLGTIKYIENYAFAQASSLRFIYFATETAPKRTYTHSFTGVASKGLVFANADTEAFRTLTRNIGENWEFDGSTTGSVRCILSDGTLHVKGSGAYTTNSLFASWYSNRSSITKIVIDEGITNIGICTFCSCYNVTEVTLNNNGVIGNKAFAGLRHLTRVNIGTGVTGFDDISSSDDSPFIDCPKLDTINISDIKSFNAIEKLGYLTYSLWGTAKEKTLLINGTAHDSTSELVFPEGITRINREAILEFKNVTKINIPSTVTSVYFSGCKYLTELTVPPTVTNVSGGAFSECTNLHTVTLDNKGAIGNWAFRDCRSLTRVNIGAGVTEFRAEDVLDGTTYYCYPFNGCLKLTTINISDFRTFNAIENLEYLTDGKYGTPDEKTLMVNGTVHNADENFYIPEGVTSYNNNALRYFSNVKKVCLPSTMTTVSGFKNHSYLTKVTLPASVTSMGYQPFFNCPNLERIVCNAATVPSTTDNIVNTSTSKITLKIPNSSSVSAYQSADYWRAFNIEGPQTYTENKSMYVLGSLVLKISALAHGTPLSWSTSDATIASVNNDGVATAKSFLYEGTTSTPYKMVKITANLGEGDTYNCNVKVYPMEVVLTDGNAYNNEESISVDKITYTRTYAEKYAGNLQCFYVPFDVEVTDELLNDFTFYELYMVSQKDVNGNGEIEDDEPLVMFLSKIPAGKVMSANMPYYIRPKAASTLTVTAENATLYAATNGTVSCSTTKNEYVLTGINDKTNIKGYYTLTSRGTFGVFASDTNLGAYRWYMSVRNRRANGAEYENYARPIEIVIEGEDDVTGIVALDDKKSTQQIDKVFTLDGRQVTNSDNLTSGIYIINGKKVFKK